MAGWRARWKWADTGLIEGTSPLALGLKVLSSFNPMRWSDFKPLPDVIMELHRKLGTDDAARPVLVGFQAPDGVIIDTTYGGRTCKEMAWHRTYGTVEDAMQKIMQGPSGLSLYRGEPHGPVPPNESGFKYRETAGSEKIICPGLRCMLNCGVLNMSAEGTCTREDLMQAQQSCGMDSPLMNVESTVGSKLGAPLMSLLDSPTQGHEKALRVCIDTPTPSKDCPVKLRNWSELAAFAKDGRFTVDEFRELYRHVHRTKERNPGKADALGGVFATLLQMIGKKDGTGKLYIPDDVLREFWMDGKPPLNEAGRWCPQIVSLKGSIDLINKIQA